MDITGKIPGMPVNCIVIDTDTSSVYVGTDLGVFYSPSGLGDWQLFEAGLPNVVVSDIQINPDSRHHDAD